MDIQPLHKPIETGSIHGFMRDKTALEAGTTIDNRKGLWTMFVEDAALEDIPYYGGAMRYAKRYAETERGSGEYDEQG